MLRLIWFLKVRLCTTIPPNLKCLRELIITNKLPDTCVKVITFFKKDKIISDIAHDNKKKLEILILIKSPGHRLLETHLRGYLLVSESIGKSFVMSEDIT